RRIRCRHGRYAGRGAKASPARSRGRLPGAPLGMARPQAEHAGRSRLFQLPSVEKPQLRRRRRDPERARGPHRVLRAFSQQLPRGKFLKALSAEGVPCSGGYSPLNKEPFLKNTFDTRAWQRLYPGGILSSYSERNQCPANDKLCGEGVWFTQTMLLGSRQDMD